MKDKSRRLSQLEIAVTDSLVSLEEEFGVLQNVIFLNLENLIYTEFEKICEEEMSHNAYVFLIE